MEIAVSVASKPIPKKYTTTERLSQEMLDTIYDYSLTLRVSESTKKLYPVIFEHLEKESLVKKLWSLTAFVHEFKEFLVFS